YEKPTDVFTARFIGSPTMNIVRAKAVHGTLQLGQTPLPWPTALPADVLVGVRPQELRVLREDETADLILSGTVAVVEPL
ncbi:hypothetical protein ACKI18_48575, partial [Streptomyces niveiscabiei]